MNKKNKKQKRLPRELFRSWMRNSEGSTFNSAKPCRLIRNVLTPDETAHNYMSNHLVSNFSTNYIVMRGLRSNFSVQIIEKVLEHVTDSKDLLNCRLVSTDWTPIATNRLTQLNVQCKSLNYHYVPKCYRSGDVQLSELIKCAKKSVQFPATSFSFRAGDMCSTDAKEFLTAMGPSVKTLTLDAVDNASLCGKMNLTAILSHTPNLQTLIFKGGSYYELTPNDPLILPALRSIILSCQYYTVNDFEPILRAAPNLDHFEGAWRLDDVKPIITTNKIHTVKRWCPSKFPFPSGLVRLATAADGELKCSDLVVNICRPSIYSSNGVNVGRLWKCLLQLFTANTIQKLILNCSNYPPGASFPLNMDSVKEIVLMPHKNPGKLLHFPIGLNLSATFPQLDTLSLYDPLYHVCCAGKKWDLCFPLSNPDGTVGNLASVTTLNLRQESVSIRMLRAMKKICPNVQNLELCIFGKLDKNQLIQELCGDWRLLKKLSIELINDYGLSSLDSAFTGLKEECLKNIIGDQTLTEQGKLRKADDTRHVLWIGNIGGDIFQTIS